jgi:5-hydroxyisourate hydrolase
MSLSTHVLDATTGKPAEGVAVRLDELLDGEWRAAAHGRTNADGRITALGDPGVGIHRLHFDTGGSTFYPEVTVTFTVLDAAAHHHVPLLLSPFAFSTYRGS